MLKGSIVVFASGTGTTFKSIYEYSLSEKSSYKVAALVTNRIDCGASHLAQGFGVPVIPFPSQHMKFLEKLKPDLIVLSGFLKIFTPEFVEKYGKKTINIHPSLLPSFGGMGFYGIRVHQAVKESGTTVTGFTVHMVEGGVDSGAVVYQHKVPVLSGDTPEDIAARVHREELEYFPPVIDSMVKNGFTVSGKTVFINL